MGWKGRRDGWQHGCHRWCPINDAKLQRELLLLTALLFVCVTGDTVHRFVNVESSDAPPDRWPSVK